MSGWAGFLVRRAIGLAALLVVLVIATFLLVRLLPGDTARLVAGPDATPETLRAIRDDLGLDEPLWTQLGLYVRDLLHLNLGESYADGQPVTSVIGDRFGVTFKIALGALAIGFALSIPLGLAAAAAARGRRSRRVDTLFSSLTSLVSALPEYVTATFLVFLFAVTFSWLPVAGTGSSLWWVLPTTAIALRPASLMARLVRVQALDVLAQDYIRTARSKRLTAWTIYVRHALPNVIAAAATVGGLVFAGLLGGVVVVENVFALPGLGTALVRAVLVHDYPVIQGIVLYLGVVVVIVNAVTDLVLALVDPRSLVKTG